MLGFNRSLAVLVGIDAYDGGIPPLRTAVADALALGRELEGSHGYEVVQLTTDVTLKRLDELLSTTLPARLGTDDRLLFYFAGHGVALDGDDGPEGYLVMQDARRQGHAGLLPMHDLHEALSALPCRHLLVILDCCFAGAFRWSATRDLEPIPEVIHQERFDRYTNDPAWQALTSAAHDQRALDVLDGRPLGDRPVDGDHSPFAAALLRGLAGAADLVPQSAPNRPAGDGVITATELYVYLREAVDVAGAATRQTPGIWPLRKHDRGEYLFLVPGRSPNLPPAPPLNTANNPYRGLEPYQEEHFPLFFGRGALIADLQKRVTEHALTVVVGASGTGKSSVVKAGLLPALRKAIDEDWHIVPPVRPGKSPVTTLATLRLPGELGSSARGPLKAGPTGPDALVRRVEAWAATNPRGRLLLVFDQFEELITSCRDDSDRSRFVEQLALVLAVHGNRVRMVLTLSTEFESHFVGGPLKDLWAAGRLPVPPLSLEELREVIVGPASERVVYFEPTRLVDRLIGEVLQTPGPLPLLSFTLSELFLRYIERRASDRSLTESDYEAVGGVAGALRNRADTVLRNLGDASRQTLRRVTLRMVVLEGGMLTKRRVPEQELVFRDPAENIRVQEVVGQLVEARLVVRDADDQNGPFIEPAHDALVRGWGTLWGWVQSQQDDILLLRRLTPAAAEWARQDGGDVKDLWAGNPRLPLVARTLEREPNWLNLAETRFVEASLARERSIRRRTVLITASVILVLAASTTFAILQAIAERLAREQQEFATQRDLGRFAELQADQPNHEVDALVTAVRGAMPSLARRRDPPAETFAGLVHAVGAHRSSVRLPKEIWALDAFSPNGHLLLTRGMEDRAQLWNAFTGRPVATIEHLHVKSAWFSTVGQTVITSGQEQARARLLDLSTGERIATLPDASFAAVAPDGQAVLTVAERPVGKLSYKLWDPSGRLIAEIDPGVYGISRVSFSADGAVFVSTAEEEFVARVWDCRTGKLLRTLDDPSAPALETAISADSSCVLTFGVGAPMATWDIRSGRLLALLKDDGDTVVAAAVAPTGGRAATVTTDGKVHLWDSTNGQQLRSLGPGGKRRSPTLLPWDGVLTRVSTAGSVAFSPKGEYVAATFAGDDIYVWEANSGREVARYRLPSEHQASKTNGAKELPDQPDSIVSAIFSPDEKALAAWRTDGVAAVWRLPDKQPKVILRGHKGAIAAAQFSSDGANLVTLGLDGTARTWDTMTGHERSRVSDTGFPIQGACVAGRRPFVVTAIQKASTRIWQAGSDELLRVIEGEVSVTPDGQLALVVSNDGASVSLLEVSTGHERGRLTGAIGPVERVVLSPDGKRAMIGGPKATATIWELSSTRMLCRLPVLLHKEDAAVFAPDGSRLFIHDHVFTNQDRDPEPKIWDVSTGRCLGKLPNDESIMWVYFSPDGARLVTIALDARQQSKLWDGTTGQHIANLASDTYQIAPEAFSRDGKRVVTGHGKGLSQIWSLDTGNLLLTLQDSVVRGVLGQTNYTAFSPDGNRVLIGIEDTVLVRDARTGAILAEKSHATPIGTCLFSPDGERIATSSGGAVCLWFPGRFQARTEIRPSKGRGFANASYSPSGKLLLTTGDDTQAVLWNVHDGKPFARLKGHAKEVVASVFSPDGERVATAARDDTARVWETTTGRCLLTLLGHGKDVVLPKHEGPFPLVFRPGSDEPAVEVDPRVGVNFVAFSPNGLHLATGGNDRTARLWDAKTGQQLAILSGHTDVIFDVTFSPDSSKLATRSFGTAKLWDVATGRLHFTVGNKSLAAVAFSPDSRRLAVAADAAWICDATSGKRVIEMAGSGSGAFFVTFSPDGQLVLVCAGSTRPKVYDAVRGTKLLTLDTPFAIRHEWNPLGDFGVRANFSHQGTRIVSSEPDGSARLWDAKSGEQLAVLRGVGRALSNFTPALIGAAYSPDDAEVLAVARDRIRMYPATWQEYFTIACTELDPYAEYKDVRGEIGTYPPVTVPRYHRNRLPPQPAPRFVDPGSARSLTIYFLFGLCSALLIVLRARAIRPSAQPARAKPRA